jgi:hypothetical protein
LLQYNLSEQIVTDYAHQCARNPMPGTICANENFTPVFLCKPVKISAYNILRTINNKTLRKMTVDVIKLR